MANADNKHPERDTTPRRGDQTQGGISHEVAEKARRERDPEAVVKHRAGGLEQRVMRQEDDHQETPHRSTPVGVCTSS